MKEFSFAFTLMELMIVLAIIGILITVAIPSYRIYTRRAHYVEVVQASGPFKLGVEECHQMMGSLEECQSGKNGVPPAITLGQGSGMIASAEVAEKGVITIVPKTKFGIQSQDTYVLTPNEDGHQLSWNTSGGGVTAGLTR